VLGESGCANDALNLSGDGPCALRAEKNQGADEGKYD